MEGNYWNRDASDNSLEHSYYNRDGQDYSFGRHYYNRDGQDYSFWVTYYHTGWKQGVFILFEQDLSSKSHEKSYPYKYLFHLNHVFVVQRPIKDSIFAPLICNNNKK